MRGYGLAIAISVCSVALRAALSPVLALEVPFILAYPAVFAAAFLAGRGPALLATVLSGVGAFLISGMPASNGGLAALLLFLSMGTLIAVVTSGWRANTSRVRESERLYRTIGETIDYGVWTCDPAGRNTYASESFLRLVGMTQQECSDFGWARVLHPGERDRTIEAWKECVRTEGVWDVEHRFLGVDGNYHHVLARGAPVRDDNGRLICWAGINLDITGLRKAQQEQLGLYESLRRNAQQLAETNRQLEQFAFAASHDLQEPLRTINIYTELLLREIGPGLTENTRRFAGFIQSAVKRQQRLIADLLAYSRAIHSDELVADSQADAARALGHAVEALKPALDESGAELHIDSLPVVSCDEAQLTQVFQNLLGNAIKYRDESRPLRIAVRCLHSGACCTFSVEDNGIGFSQAYAEQIFGLFKRLHRERYPGTGLGLAMCRRVVERYGGRIWAESQPGEGSTFRFTLPLPRSADTKPSESELTSAEDTRNLITDR